MVLHSAVPSTVVSFSSLPPAIAAAFASHPASLPRFDDGDDPNLWVALALGALVVNVPGLNVLLAVPLLFLAAGAMVDRQVAGRRTDPAEPNPGTAVD